jgi:RimJ/RimL family protein N-acetyltransferase
MADRAYAWPMWTKQTFFRRAHAADIPAIMEIERQPGYERLVGRWTEAEHLRNISSPGYLYLVHDGTDAVPEAFVALSGLGDKSGDVMINRMIVRTPGKGTGSAFLRVLIATLFEGSPTYRLWLRVLPENQRALRLYRAQGFREERILPGGGRLVDGSRVDLILMSIEREAWDLGRP